MGKLKLLIACLAVCSIIISASGCIGGKKIHDGEFMTFEYPKDWTVTGACGPNFYGGGDVVLFDKHGHGIGIMSVTNETLQTFEEEWAEETAPGFWEWCGKKKIGNVECSIYEGGHGITYIFQKDGTVFQVDCPIEVEYVAEDIIKSIKPKK